MNDQPQIDLNVEQWRRDVNSFVATTMQELAEISDLLASGVASPGQKKSNAANENHADGCDDRLAKLKLKLMKRD